MFDVTEALRHDNLKPIRSLIKDYDPAIWARNYGGWSHVPQLDWNGVGCSSVMQWYLFHRRD